MVHVSMATACGLTYDDTSAPGRSNVGTDPQPQGSRDAYCRLPHTIAQIGADRIVELETEYLPGGEIWRTGFPCS